VGLAGESDHGNLQERNGWFHLQFRYQGRQFSHGLGTQERKEAEAIRGSVDRALIRIKNRELTPPGTQDDVVAFLLAGGKVVEVAAPVKAPLTAKELRDQYLQAHGNGAIETNSLATVRLHLNHVLHHLGDRFVIRDLKNQQLQDYLDKRAGAAARRAVVFPRQRSEGNRVAASCLELGNANRPAGRTLPRSRLDLSENG